jgi:uncharacterized protein
VQRPTFTLAVRDLERADQERKWEVPPEWVDWAMADTEAQSDGTAGTLEVYAKKNGREVLVKGQVRASITMPCARTLEPVAVKLEAPILLLLTPRPGAAAGPGKVGRRQRGRADAEDEASAEQLSAEQAARDEYDGDTVELDGFVREHLLLELPLFPVRSDLPFDPTPATDTRPDEAGPVLDPRLAPLAALASELQRTGKLPGSK